MTEPNSSIINGTSYATTPLSRIKQALLCLCLPIAFTACGDSPEPANSERSAEAINQQAQTSVNPVDAALQTLLSNRFNAHAEQLSLQLGTLEQAIDSLLDNPTPASLESAQQAWRVSYQSYNEARPYLLCAALTNDKLSGQLKRSDLFPIFPGYIDSLKQWPGSGLVNDISIELTEASLLQQQGFTSESDVTTGFQVMEFLLFGEADAARPAAAFAIDLEQQFEEAAEQVALAEQAADEAAQPGTDGDGSNVEGMTEGMAEGVVEGMAEGVVEGMATGDIAGGAHPLEDHPSRRRLYLRLITALLLSDLSTLAGADISAQ
jgi:uncharacterized iron-regulated protein